MKTNATRLLDLKNISYQEYDLKIKEFTSGINLSKLLNKEPNIVYKTLVTISSNNKYYVFVIPVNKELNLKKCAKIVNEKKIEMLKQKDLYNLTGYYHGGCSPIGMKKIFPTYFNNTVIDKPNIIINGGKMGYQIEINYFDIKDIFNYREEELI